MKNLRPFLFVGGLAAIGVALYRYYNKQIEFIKDVQYRVTGLKILSISKEKVSFEITTSIYNASNVEFVVKQIDMSVNVNGVQVADISEVKDIQVMSNGFSYFSFNFSFDPKKVAKDISSIISTALQFRDVMIDVVGQVKVKSAFLSASIPYEYRNNLKNMIKR